MSTWGRHGWPRKDEGARLYRERDGAYLMVIVDSEDGYYLSAIANVLSGPEPSLGSLAINRNYTHRAGCTRVQWSELPNEWKTEFRHWLDKAPEMIRGFWLVGAIPAASAATQETHS